MESILSFPHSIATALSLLQKKFSQSVFRNLKCMSYLLLKLKLIAIHKYVRKQCL